MPDQTTQLTGLIVGLGGHVDHGKTALVKAMTGIDTQRPTERKLGMTQDINFARFNSDGQPYIALTDVPGHERYLRNMVAGVADIDVLLLVVSAVEGCMPMTYTHTQVAIAMGVTQIVIALTKTDLVDPSTLANIEDQVLEQIMDVTGVVPDIVPVSIHNPSSIEALKATLVSYIPPLATGMDMNQTLTSPATSLYVDRAFTIQGAGTVVTGSLTTGQLTKGDKLILEPSGVEAKVRSLQTHNQACESVVSKARVAIGLKGIAKHKLKRGTLLRSSNFNDFSVVSQCFVKNLNLGTPESSTTLTNHRPNRRILACSATWSCEATLIPVCDGVFYRVIFDNQTPITLNQRIVFLSLNQGAIIATGSVVWDEFIPRNLKHQTLDQLDEIYSKNDKVCRQQIKLEILGYCKSEGAMLASDDTVLSIDGYRIDKSWHKEQLEKIVCLLEKFNHLSQLEISHKLQLDLEITKVLLKFLKHNEKIVNRYGKWQLGRGSSEDDLDPDVYNLLQHIRSLGKVGFETNKTDYKYKVKWLRLLAHAKYITAISESIYLDAHVYTKLAHQVLCDRNAHDTIELQEIKNSVQLSRKYLIPFVNRLERDGYLRRNDDVRVILKTPAIE